MERGTANINARQVALEAAEAADAKKGQKILILEVSRLSMVADYFVIASADNRTQLQAMADETRDRLRRQGGLHLHHTEGYGDTGWILMDCGDVVIHYLLEDRREFYGLERLWGDAPRVEFKGGDLSRSAAPRGDEHVE